MALRVHTIFQKDLFTLTRYINDFYNEADDVDIFSEIKGSTIYYIAVIKYKNGG